MTEKSIEALEKEVAALKAERDELRIENGQLKTMEEQNFAASFELFNWLSDRYSEQMKDGDALHHDVMAVVKYLESQVETYKRGYEGREKAKQMWFEKAQERQQEIEALKVKNEQLEKYAKTLMDDTGDLYDHIGNIVKRRTKDPEAVFDLQQIESLFAESDNRIAFLQADAEKAKEKAAAWEDVCVTCWALGMKVSDKPVETVKAFIGSLLADAEKARERAVEFAKAVFYALTIERTNDAYWRISSDVWIDGAFPHFVEAGFIEKHPENNWYRWLSSPAQGAEEVKR